jgi:hypothetical protein
MFPFLFLHFISFEKWTEGLREQGLPPKQRSETLSIRSKDTFERDFD